MRLLQKTAEAEENQLAIILAAAPQNKYHSDSLAGGGHRPSASVFFQTLSNVHSFLKYSNRSKQLLEKIRSLWVVTYYVFRFACSWFFFTDSTMSLVITVQKWNIQQTSNVKMSEKLENIIVILSFSVEKYYSRYSGFRGLLGISIAGIPIDSRRNVNFSEMQYLANF